MRVLTQGNFGKFQKGGKSCDQAKKNKHLLQKDNEWIYGFTLDILLSTLDNISSTLDILPSTLDKNLHSTEPCIKQKKSSEAQQ